jgi:hypothetical protein
LRISARAGSAWRETDEADTDLETIQKDILSGQFAYPLRIVCFNPVAGRGMRPRMLQTPSQRTLAAQARRSRLRCRTSSTPGPRDFDL